MQHQFTRKDIIVNDGFINDCAQMYVSQRTQCVTAISNMSTFLFTTTGFNTEDLRKIIVRNVIAEDAQRDGGTNPAILNDIYRSDLGELLMTKYFEHDIEDEKKFIIPLKNITFRELSHLPGRGLDAIGYRVEGVTIHLLLGEAKVSSSSQSPPSVVDRSEDSMFKTQLNRVSDKKAIVQKLSDYARRLNSNDAMIMALAILSIEKDLNNHTINFGCTLIRDYVCVNETNDYGKLKTDVSQFGNHSVLFALISFTGKTIAETVDLFYSKVKELAVA
ncbi:hypothetical protein [Pinibacter aurantiacus]|uniref:Anti-bacteriophage protein A/HamA C-terminal domain-containing protein n=1 Tax=Pinibacter aurantiacus TaxID=2851599 RepID=A0A9E2W2U0_9BACT|nr:hypothetical protein [Pinibacter aurantiacus]MBV4357705.1 hypothetical protein [Pinibacter aurantiacus]